MATSFAPVDPNELAAFHSMLSAPQQHSAAHSGNFLTHLLPTIGGTGGAIGGAAVGTALLPGVGTLAGALLGGALGGGASKVGENAIEHQALGNGVAGQALEQGVLGAGPIRLAKTATFGTKAAIDAARSGEGLSGAINAANEVATAPSAIRTALAGKGNQMEARAGGFGIGEKQAGQSPLGFYDSRKIAQNLKTEGIGPGSPETRLQKVEDALNTKWNQISKLTDGNNKVLSTDQKNKIVEEFRNAVDMQPGVNQQTRDFAENYINNFQKQANDTKGLIEFRRGMDNQVIAYNRNPDGKDAADQLAAHTFRNVLSKNTNDLIPGVQTLNKSYSNLTDAKGFLIGGAKAISDQSQGQGGGGLVGRLLTNDTAQATKSRTGAALQHLAPSENFNPLSPGAIAGRTVPLGLAQASASSAPGVQSQTGTPQQSNPTDLSGALTNATDTSGATQSNSPYSQADLMYDIQRDPKNADKYIANYQSLDKIFNPSSSTTNTIKPTGQQYGLATGGYNSLQQLSQLLGSDPSLAAKNQTPGQGLPLVGNLITNAAGAGDYHALADNVLQSLIHLQTGATATPEEVKAARGQLPGPGDTPEEVQRKLNNLATMFAPYIQGGQLGGSSGSSSDLANALVAAGYGQ